MKQHRYRITVEHLTDENGAPSAHAEPLQFEIGNHDDILSIIERMRGRGEFDAATAAAFGLGLKLFGEVMLENRQNSLFEPLRVPFSQFMKGLKNRPTAD